MLFEIDRERALLLTPNETPSLSRPPRTRGEAPTAGPCRVTCPVTCPPAARNFPRAAAPRRASLGARGEGEAAETASNPTRSAAETDRARRTAAGTPGAAAAAGAATATSRRRRAGRKAAAGAAAAAGANLGAGTGGAAALAARGRGTRERSRRRRRRTSTTSGSPGNRCTKVTRRSAGLDRRRGRRGPRRTPEGDKLVLAAAGEEGGCDIGAEVYDRCCAVPRTVYRGFASRQASYVVMTACESWCMDGRPDLARMLSLPVHERAVVPLITVCHILKKSIHWRTRRKLVAVCILSISCLRVVCSLVVVCMRSIVLVVHVMRHRQVTAVAPNLARYVP